MRLKSILVAATLAALILPAVSTSQVSALEPNSVAKIFERYIEKKELANPSVVVMDQTNGEVVFAKNAHSLRKPASVQKILAAVSALTFLDPSETFTTTVSLGSQTRTLVIEGSRDPWVSFNLGSDARTDHHQCASCIPLVIKFCALKAY